MKKIILYLLLCNGLFCFAQKQPKVAQTLIYVYEDFDGVPSPANVGNVDDIIVIDTTNPNNIWQVGVPHKSFLTTWSSMGPYALITDTLNPYPPNNHSWFDIRLFKPDWAIAMGMCWSKVGLSMLLRYNTDTLYDGLYFTISYDNGLNWTNIMDDTVPDNETNICHNLGYMCMLNNGEKGYSGTSFNNISPPYDRIHLCFDKNWNNNHAFEIDSCIIRVHFVSDSIYSGKEGVIFNMFDIIVQDRCNVNIADFGNDKSGVNIYPNPVNSGSVLCFSNVNFKTAYLAIYNSEGKLVKLTSTNGNIFSLGSLGFPGRVYYYQLYIDNNIFFKGKFLIE